MGPNGFGVYVHFPYCRARCGYCDFAIHVRRRIPHDAYASAVEQELTARAPIFAGRALASIYFGGGTPSLWEPDAVARVIASVRSAFPSTSAPREVTLEANPDDLPRERLAALRRAGVDRLSIGAQSFDGSQLATLGRLHGDDDIRRSVADARAEGFARISVDLMYGLPAQSTAALAADLDALLALDVPHLSAYQLTVEERTPFGAYQRRGSLPIPGDERLADMAEAVHDRLEAAGYTHYEVSSYARPGSQSIHNSLYWSGGEWLGLGSAAHSFRRTSGSPTARSGGERWSTEKNVDRYMAATAQAAIPAPAVGASVGSLVAHHELLSDEALAREAVWLGLRRLDEGVSRRDFADRFGADPAARFSVELEPLAHAGLVEVSPARIRLTRRGALLADEVGARFL